MISGASKLLTVAGCRIRGSTLKARKRSCDATQIDTAGAVMLKSARYHSGRRLAIQNEITKPSSATVIVPAADPNKRTEANTNVSDIEIVAGIDGSLTVADPLTRVSAARRYHCCSIVWTWSS